MSIAAQHNALLVLDNISTIQPWLSDALCRLSTGGGLGTRTLFKNQEETVFDGMLPVVLTAIEDVANRSDLLDRALVFTLPTIPPDRRCTEAVFWADLDANAGLIMGGLLDLLAGVLRELPDATLTEFPRMADFALLGVALERAAGWPEGAFMDAYTANRGQVNASAIDAAVIGRALVTFLDVKCEGKGFTGMVAGLLHALNEHEGYTPTGARPPAGWPATPRAFGGHLRRLAPNLRANGFDVLLGTRTAKGQPVTIAPQPEPKPDPQRAQRTQRASQARKPAESDVCSPGPMYIDLHQHTQPGADSQAQNALSARCVCPEPNPAADDDSEVF